MSTEIVASGAGEVAELSAPITAVDLMPIAVGAIVARQRAVEDIVANLFQPGVHYGPAFPGASDQTLEKPGAELLAAAFGLALDYQVREHKEDDGGRRYVSVCNVTHQPTGTHLGSGWGEASTGETKFAWRKASKQEYETAASDRRREVQRDSKSGGGSYTVYQVREESADKANTLLKMANKRAASDAIQSVLGIRGLIKMNLNPNPRDGQKNAPQVQLIDEEMAANLTALAIRKGHKNPERGILTAHRRNNPGCKAASFAELTVADYGIIVGRLLSVPDVVTAEPQQSAPADTGEEVAEQADDVQEGMEL